jgi:hypothetical protein
MDSFKTFAKDTLIENILMQILSKCYIPQTHLKWIVMDMF